MHTYAYMFSVYMVEAPSMNGDGNGHVRERRWTGASVSGRRDKPSHGRGQLGAAMDGLGGRRLRQQSWALAAIGWGSRGRGRVQPWAGTTMGGRGLLLP